MPVSHVLGSKSIKTAKNSRINNNSAPFSCRIQKVAETHRIDIQDGELRLVMEHSLAVHPAHFRLSDWPAVWNILRPD